jgi:hypothetical protein
MNKKLLINSGNGHHRGIGLKIEAGSLKPQQHLKNTVATSGHI